MDQLRHVLAQDDTVLFIGSGISRWSGLPSWPGLIAELADFIDKSGGKSDLIRNEARRGDLLQAASYGFDMLTKHQIGDFIRSACRFGIAKPHEVHKKIISLGPRCFITTNYDNLIEESLRLWRPDNFFRPPVTNRHLTEIAEIVHAKAIDFVFKPHGDLADIDSIILSREQYRQLMPGGERQAALESVKILMVSRPVVYFGFGLRDPDFLYVKDLLLNTYKGGTRDHYAIMSDIEDEEIVFWKRNYGIHLVNYQTTQKNNELHDHSGFLKLLDELRYRSVSSSKTNIVTEESSYPHALLLALARHAGRLTRFVKSEPEFQIRVHLENWRRAAAKSFYVRDAYNHYPIDQFLSDEGPDRAVLVGLPGAGKTYSLKRASAQLGEKLYEACLNENFDEKNILIPILADLKLYNGDLRLLLEQTLPRGLSLECLTNRFKIRIFLDSFNEMPREQWENGTYEADFGRFIASMKNTTFVICSRTRDGLSKLNFPFYCMNQIDEKYVTAELQRRSIKTEGRFGRELRSLLQKPFYFQLYISGKATLSQDPHPKDIFQSFFHIISNSFEFHFNISFDLEKSLSIIAYNALSLGEETQPLYLVLQVLRRDLQGAGFVNVDPLDVANWLVSKSIFIPYIGGRIAFCHQSVTEFLAATELAHRYQRTPQILQEKLNFTRWDQAIFLTLSFLPQETGIEFLKSVIKTDFILALNAAKYIEVGRDEVVTRLLDEILYRIKVNNQFKEDIRRAYGIRELPVSEVHETQLCKIMAHGGMIGTTATALLIELKGSSAKSQVLQSLFDLRNDFNYCSNVRFRAIEPYIDEKDVKKMVGWADFIEEEGNYESNDAIIDAFASQVGAVLSGSSIDLVSIRDMFLPSDEFVEVPKVKARILCSVLNLRPSSASLELAAELLLHGVNEAASIIYSISHSSKFEDKLENNLSWSSFSKDHVKCLLAIIQKKDNANALRALRYLCEARTDLAEVVRTSALNERVFFKTALLYCISPNDSTPIFDALLELTNIFDEQRRDEAIYLFSSASLDWAGREELLVRLLKLRDVKLATGVLSFFQGFDTLGELDIGPIEWWLDWLMDDEHPDVYWLRSRISHFFERHLPSSVRDSFVAEFNRPGSKYRRTLANSILLARNDLTTDDFSEEAISFLLSSLKEDSSIKHQGHLLGNTATEPFVTESLLPLLSITEEPLARNLRQVLRRAGSRHSRRYLVN